MKLEAKVKVPIIEQIKTSVIVRMQLYQHPFRAKVQILTALPDLSRAIMAEYDIDKRGQSSRIIKWWIRSLEEFLDDFQKTCNESFSHWPPESEDETIIIAVSEGAENFKFRHDVKDPLILEILARMHTIILYECSHCINKETRQIMTFACQRLSAVIRQNQSKDIFC